MSLSQFNGLSKTFEVGDSQVTVSVEGGRFCVSGDKEAEYTQKHLDFFLDQYPDYAVDLAVALPLLSYSLLEIILDDEYWIG